MFNRRKLLCAAPWLALAACKPAGTGAPGNTPVSGGMTEGSGEFQLAYTIEVEVDGKPKSVGENSAFRNGERFRFVLKPGAEAFLYLYDRGPGQTAYQRIYPDFRSGAANPASKGAETRIPGPDAWLKFDSSKGVENAVLVASSLDLPEFNTTENSVARDEFEERLAQVERRHRPASARRFVDGDWVKWFAARGASGGKDVAIVIRLPLLHGQS